jgi:hypothetical protein
MASKFSHALANAIAGDQPWDAVLRGGHFILFSGSVPALPETAVDAGQVLMELTRSEGVWVATQSATAAVTFTAVGIGDTVALTVGGIPLHSLHTATTTDGPTEATALALAISNSPYNLGVRATAAGSVVTLYAPYGTGTLFNDIVVANTGAGGTIALSGNFAGGVDGAYGLDWTRDATTLNQLSKPTADAWSGTCPVEVTTPVAATFFRYVLDSGDDGYSDDTVNKAFRRWQGTVGGSSSSSADLKFPLVSTSVVAGVKLSVGTYSFTIPLS